MSTKQDGDWGEALVEKYLSERELDVPARFDVAEVYTDVHRSAGKTRIAYIENAF